MNSKVQLDAFLSSNESAAPKEAALNHENQMNPSENPSTPAAVATGQQALAQLAEFCCKNRATDTARRIRELLLSLYNGQPCNLSEIHSLDALRRRALCIVLLSLGDTLWDYQIRVRFTVAGEPMLRWFTEPLKLSDDDIRYFIATDLEEAT